MRILGIDPGTYESALLLYETEGRKILQCAIDRNEQAILTIKLRGALRRYDGTGDLDLSTMADVCVIEWISSYGMAVGKDTFETCYWVGRFSQAFQSDQRFKREITVHRFLRRDIKLHLCNSARAKDANVRQALMDRFEPIGKTGKGKPSVIGTKKHPGPLYGITSHLWSALAVAVAWEELQNGERR